MDYHCWLQFAWRKGHFDFEDYAVLFCDSHVSFFSIFQELYADCDKLRQTVWDLATEAEDNDSSLGKSFFQGILLIVCVSFF